MAKITDKTGPIEDQLLESVKQGQDAIVKAVRTWAEATENLRPDLPDLPLVDQLPRMSEVVDTSFAFADKLFASQREFAAAIVEAAKPAFGGADLAAAKVKSAKSGTSVVV